MASLCTRCALRILRSAASEPPALRLARPFSSTTSRNAHAIPQFSQTSNAELDDVLATMRNKHFLPAALTPAQRKLIFGHSKRDELASNPQAVDIAGERFQLQWMDRRTEIPNRTKLFRRAVRLMAEHGGDEAWRNLIQLLIGLHRSGVTISRVDMERLLRIAVDHGRFDSILQCMRKTEETGITLTRPEVLGAVLLALRKQGRKDDWSQESIERAMAQGRLVAQLLEMEKHGASEKLKENDLRKDPRVIGVYLELSAVFAWRHQDGKDADGRVRAYTERLLYNLAGAKEMSAKEPSKAGPQTDMLLGLSVWHGLNLADKILGMDMPNGMLASEARNNYGSNLWAMARTLEERDPSPTPGGYVDQALSAWRECQED